MRFHDALKLSANVVGTGEMSEREEVLVAPLFGAVGVRCGLALESVVGVKQGQVVSIGRGNGKNLVGAVKLGRRDEHDSQSGIQRERRGHATESGQLTIIIETGEIVELLKSSHHSLRSGRVHKIKVDKILDTELLELQNCVGKIGAQNLGVCLLNQFLLEGFLCVKSETLSGLCTTSTTSSLLGRGLRDGRNQKGLDTDTRVVNLLLAETGVHDVDDTVNGQTGFGDVGGNDDLTARATALAKRCRSLVEDALLLMRSLKTDLATSVFNLIFTSQEEQNITLRLRSVDLENSSYGSLNVIALRLGGIEDLDRVGSTRDSEQRCIVEVLLEFLSVKSSRHDDNLKVGAAHGNLLEQGHKNIGRKGTFVSLIENNTAIARHLVVVHGLAQKHTIGHVLEHGLGTCHVLETNAVTDFLTQGNVHFVGDTLRDRHGGDSTRLGTSDELASEVR
ncbi:hypothetical protein HG531_011088 [Fusarium graminearum]|nr:hypothetical protein HG531_011088 [Fusarium graminearum]